MGTRVQRINGESDGFDGSSVFVLDDGSIYRQTQYYYRYRYAYRPKVWVINEREILIEGIDKSVGVERLN